MHSKDKGRGEEPLIVQVQLTGKLVVTSSQLAPPTRAERIVGTPTTPALLFIHESLRRLYLHILFLRKISPNSHPNLGWDWRRGKVKKRNGKARRVKSGKVEAEKHRRAELEAREKKRGIRD